MSHFYRRCNCDAEPEAVPAPAPPPAAAADEPPFDARDIVVPSPDQICASCECWGEGGRWIEPWDDQTAKDTLRRIYAKWTGTQDRPRAPDVDDGKQSDSDRGAT